MSENLQLAIPGPPQRDSGRFRFVFPVGLALIVVLAGFYLWPSPEKTRAPSTTGMSVSFGPAEQAYAQKIRLENIALSRAENFLHQEVTTLSGDVTNGGSQPLAGLELTIEFFDDLHQIVLRESRSALEESRPPLAPAERRAFAVSFEHVSSSWNMQPPVVRVTGLQFVLAK